jgi:hypothetical protein
MGYHEMAASEIYGESMMQIKRQLERCDKIESLVVINSASGATGGGCGLKLMQNLKEKYPK